MSAGRFGISEATRSPGFSPRPSKLTARRSLSSSSVRHVQRVSAEISASPSGLASRPARSRSRGRTGLSIARPAYPVTLPPVSEINDQGSLPVRTAPHTTAHRTGHRGRQPAGDDRPEAPGPGGWSGPGHTPAAEDEGRGLAAKLPVERRGGVGAGPYRSPLARAAGK